MHEHLTSSKHADKLVPSLTLPSCRVTLLLFFGERALDKFERVPKIEMRETLVPASTRNRKEDRRPVTLARGPDLEQSVWIRFSFWILRERLISSEPLLDSHGWDGLALIVEFYGQTVANGTRTNGQTRRSFSQQEVQHDIASTSGRKRLTGKQWEGVLRKSSGPS